jgi:hypothetical protein
MVFYYSHNNGKYFKKSYLSRKGIYYHLHINFYLCA